VESHEYMSTPSAYDGVNGVTFASLNVIAIRHRPSVLCIRFSAMLSDLVSLSIDVLFPSFGIYNIAVANPHQSSPTLAVDQLD